MPDINILLRIRSTAKLKHFNKLNMTKPNYSQPNQGTCCTFQKNKIVLISINSLTLKIYSPRRGLQLLFHRKILSNK